MDEGANEVDKEEGEVGQGEVVEGEVVVDETAEETKYQLSVLSVWQNLSLKRITGSQRARGFPAQIKVISSLRFQACVWVVSGAKIISGENTSVPPS